MDKPTLSMVASFYVIIPILLILVVTSLYLRTQQQMNPTQNKQIKWLVMILLLIYLLVYVWLTFLYRVPGTQPRTRLVPFKTYSLAFQLNPLKIRYQSVAREIFHNILLTVPVGLFVPLLFEKRSYLKTAGIAFLLAVLTEGFQYITRLGTCETDDVISNFLGCLIGMSFMVVGTKIIQTKERKREANKQEKLSDKTIP